MGQNLENPFSSVTKVICHCMLTVPKSEVFLSLFFLFLLIFFFFFFTFLFVPFFCLELFLSQTFTGGKLRAGYLLNVTTHRRNGLFPRKNPKTQVTEGIVDIDFLGILKKERVEIPRVN